MLGKDPPCTAALSTMKKGCKYNLLPLSTAGHIDEKGAKGGDFSISARCSYTKWRVWAAEHCEGSGQGTVHLRLFKARLSPLSLQNHLEGNVGTSPHFLQELVEDLQNRPGRLNNSAGGFSSAGETPREKPERARFELLTGRQSTWGPRPYFTETIKQSSESCATRGFQGTTQPQLAHRAVIYTKQERAGTLTHIVPSVKQSYLIRNYTLLEINWDRIRQEV